MSRKTVSITIHNRQYHLACDSSEEAGLRASAAYLDQKMDEIKEDSRGVMGAERLAIMAALQISRELVDKKSQISNQQMIKQRLQVICHHVEDVIKETKA